MAALSRADLIAVLQRTMDDGWLAPLLADPDSAAVLDAIADALAVVSLLGQQACDDTTISNSAAGRGGASTITLSRAATGTSGTIPQGYAFVDARGLAAVAISDVTVGSGASTVAVAVVTVRKTELANTQGDPGYSIAPNQPVKDGGGTNALIGQSPAPSGYPPIVATTFTAVASSTPISGGATDWLAAVGFERGQVRQAGEDDASFRVRVRNVPDAVSPVAVSAAALGAASRAGLSPPTFEEPFNDGADASVRQGYGIDWFDSLYFSGAVDSNGNADESRAGQVDFFEDVQPDLTVAKVRETVSLREASCYFREVVPGPLPDTDSERVFFDDDGYFDDPVLGYLDVRDDGAQVAALMAVWSECNNKRAAGVRFDEYVDVTKRVTARGSTSSASPTVVLTMTPPGGKEWLLRDGHFGWDTATAPAMSWSGSSDKVHGTLTFTFDDSSTYTTPDLADPFGQRVIGPLGLGHSRITQVQGTLHTNGVRTAQLVANIVVLEVVA